VPANNYIQQLILFNVYETIRLDISAADADCAGASDIDDDGVGVTEAARSVALSVRCDTASLM